MGAIALIEETLPCISMFPTASLTFIWTASSKEESAEEGSSYLPIDYFILDAASHLVLTFIMTYFILMEPSIWANVVELLIVTAFIFDEAPDILFAGVAVDSTSMASVFVRGFTEYWSSTGYE